MNTKDKDGKLFYKYQKVNRHLLDNLKRNQLYFSSPCEYNDPFDSKINAYSELTEKQWIEGCIESHPGLSINGAKKSLNWNIDTGNWRRSGNLIVKEFSNVNHTLLTCCFCEKPDNVLMWSHYADHHKGVCLSFKPIYQPVYEPELHEFKYKADYLLTVNSERIPLLPIKYNKNMPNHVKFEKGFDLQLFDFLLTKSTRWKYEKESRLILSEPAIDNKYNFEKKELEGIIFGLKVNYLNARRIHNIIKKYYKGIPVNFYRAVEIKNKYAIRIKPILNIDEYIESLR